MELEIIIENYLAENGFEDLKGYEGFYKINRNGNIWSCRYKKIMTFLEDKYFYLNISLTKEGIKKHYRIHRLLAIQYIENPENLPEVDHIDRNTKNNDLSNLRWADDYIQANNKKTNIANMTEEEQEQRKLHIRERSRVWAENKRRENGVKPKITFESEEERQEHYKEKARESQKKRIEEMTPEEKQEYYEHKNEINRKSYANRVENMSEEDLKEFRQQALERSKKQRETEDKEAVRKYKAEWARNKRKQLKDAKPKEN
jgi:hypothetical protein